VCKLRKGIVLFAGALAIALQSPSCGARQALVIYGGMGDGTVAGSEARQSSRYSRRKELVEFARDLAPGSIVISTSLRALYLVLPDGKAWKYPVGVGREGFAWSGEDLITRKAEWPEWRPPSAMVEREKKRGHSLPVVMRGGSNNPLGARALYIGNTEYRIHGTTQPWSIGRAVSSGCIRMLNEHVIDLYDVVSVGARVIVER
jgi:lipoprotein-anchoring transpeptidase ErfK/SrfK